MKFFEKIKHLFFPPIKTDKAEEEKLITRYRLRGDLRIGSDIIVSDGHWLVTTFYNRACDVLESGTVRVNDKTMPCLYKLNQKRALKKGQESLKTLKADLYFISDKEVRDVFFSTSEKCPLFMDKERLVAKILGQLSFKVVDAYRLVSHLIRDHRTIHLYTAYREILIAVSEALTSIIYGGQYPLASVIKNNPDTIKDWLEKLHILEETIGVKITGIEVYDLSTSKKYYPLLEDARVGIRVEEELMREAEKALEPVPVFAGGQSSDVKNETEENSHKVESDHTIHTEEQNAIKAIEESSQNFAPIFHEDITSSMQEQDAPHILDEPQEPAQDTKKSASNAEPLDNIDADHHLYKICASCGAKNDANATICTTCGSEMT